MGEFLETYRGEALAWEADDLGHLNMRFYFARSGQARTVLLASLGLTNAFKAHAFSTAIISEQHIHYLAELLPGRGIIVETGVINIDKTDMTIVHMIKAAPNTLSAVITEKITHISTRTHKPFSWPSRVREMVKSFTIEPPKQALPRNIDLKEKPGIPTLKAARELGLQAIGRGAFLPGECDVFGFVRPYDIIGRVSDSVQHITTGWPDIAFTGNHSISGAILEGRIMHRKRPEAGDCYVIYSGLRQANTHVRELCHWILDPVSGNCWASMIGVACKFDLKARRLIKNDKKVLALLEKNKIKGLVP
ncbi:MAG: thioesterase [Acidimicrobiales bacterium]|nr:thioesterase family protein [Hyphomonadaceae bacterium]RZV35245.1 MAG: thioesterase [Acidimicrobiales bacterium]